LNTAVGSLGDMNKKRIALLMELERIVGKQCYNGNIQNYGPGGMFEGEGRSFRYPLTVIEDGKNAKVYDRELPANVVMTGHYAFGANQLHIVRALDKILEHLEQNHQLKII
jgi:hypothetical protein